MTGRCERDIGGGYRVAGLPAPGLARVTHPEHGPQLWTARRTRKDTRCAATGNTIAKGAEVFAPMTNGYNRSHRIAADIMRGRKS